MHLKAEIVDVSLEGMVHFQNVLLANVTLERGLIASTTLNDYEQAIGYSLTYYTDDDEEYDMDVTIVPWGDSGVFGEDFKVINDTISDCLYLMRPPDVVMPGCSNRTAEARNRIIDRNFLPTIDGQSNGVPFDDSAVVDYDSADTPLDGDANGATACQCRDSLSVSTLFHAWQPQQPAGYRLVQLCIVHTCAYG